MAISPKGELLVANSCTDPAYNGLLRFSTSSGALLGVIPPPPEGTAFADVTVGPDGALYACDGAGLFGFPFPASVYRLDPASGTWAVLVPQHSGGLEHPMSLTFGPDGNLYVASSANARVLRYNGTTGYFIDTFVAPGSGGLTAAVGIVFGPDGLLYVSGAGSVFRYDGKTGAFKDEFVTKASNQLVDARGLLFGPDGLVYVCDRNPAGGRVVRFDKTGVAQGALVPATKTALFTPRDIAFAEMVPLRIRIPSWQFMEIIVGILGDGGGIGRFPRGPIFRVPPRPGPQLDILAALAIEEVTSLMTDEAAAEIRAALYGVVKAAAESELRELKKSSAAAAGKG